MASSGDDVLLGRGCLYFQPDGTIGYCDLGNVTEANLAVAVEKAESFSFRKPLKVKEVDIVTQLTETLNFTLNHIIPQNLDLFLYGNGVVTSNQASATETDLVKVAALDKCLRLGKVNLTSSLKVDSADEAATFTSASNTVNVVAHTFIVGDQVVFAAGAGGTLPAEIIAGTIYYVITIGAGTFTMSAALGGAEFAFTDDGTPLNDVRQRFVLDSDYTEFLPDGLVCFLSTGKITASENVLITFDYGDATLDLIDTGVASKKEGLVLFIGDPANGPGLTLDGFANITPEGDLALLTDDFAGMGFSAELLLRPAKTGFNSLSQITRRQAG